ncbi:probable ATP-dependent RNA helicase DHX37 [Mizuhopecten yessoensis]|uniref:probable ATP-dependent RNA helicase DHX37 n=1 Tax=Mizuhopecten yessoensis TaxID=6573 RepID=UPI000B458B3A|nr:probable ATP-dependent RNA helicase DHX37 [Mizuhopecten yessoensis]
MGKKKRAFNWKAREQHETVVDRSAEKKIKLDSTVLGQDDDYDEDNMLVLPSEKRKSKTTTETIQTVKKLSKKERKRLQNVLLQKEKKAKRAALLESLAKVQAKPEEMLQYVGVAAMQSGHLKRETETKQKKLDADSKINVVAGSNKKTKYSQWGDNCDAEGGDSDASESSIDTSDMSTDEEQEETMVDDEDVKNELETIAAKSEKGMTGEKENELEDKEKIEKSKTEQKDKEDKENSKPAVNIPVNRDKDIQEARLKLPILAEEQMVMETINDSQVTIVCGETGSGKTTQVPQFLYEAGYAHGEGIIGVTEPRRVAAISMSHRVGKEMNLTTSEVSYQIRYEGNVTPKTKIKFMTDGVLLKEVQKDFLLTKYSVIIIDEAHERSVYTDILIGLLSRIVPLRHKKGSPLKLIIMSATLRVEDFTDNARLFRVTPPVVKVDSRQFPVTIHFNKRTPLDNTYLNEAYKKVCKIHRKLPEGGILVFVTGQQEVNTLCRKLRQTFPATQGGKKEEDIIPGKKKNKRTESPEKKNLPKISLDNYSVEPTDEEEEREGGSDSEAEFDETSDGSDDDNILGEDGGCSDPMFVLPLYSMLSSDRQAKVFAPPPNGYRLCVVATNVAETSLTIPNVKYVVDTGKVKTKFYDKVTGVSTFRITWTSSASANQRAGRAGRTGPGHCYRLYSSAVFTHDFEKFSPAEITRRPVDDLVLQMKDMNIDKVMNFPYPTPPDWEQIKAAERLLVSLGALTAPVSRPKSRYKSKEVPSQITPLGRAMAHFPVSPRYSKMLSLGHQHDLLPYVVAMVAALSVAEVFVELHQPPDESGEKDEFKKRLQHFKQIQKMWAGNGHSLLLGDLTVLLKAVGSCEYQGCTPEFCQKHGIRFKAMKEVRKLRVQLTNSVNTVIPGANLCVDPKLDPPNDLQSKLLRQIILAGLGDHVARKYPDPPPGADDEAKKLKYAYQCAELEEPLFIHPSSVLYRQNPQLLVYQRIEETSRLYMKGLVAMEAEWLPIFCPSHCTFSKPLDDPAPEFDETKGEVMCHMTSTFSRCTWGLPAIEMEYPLTLEKYKWFARFLLEGKVIPGLAKFTTMLLSSPSTMVKTWAKLQPRTEVLLKCLAGEGVDCRDTLLSKWKTQPTYLFDAYSQWIPKANHFELEAAWPPVT